MNVYFIPGLGANSQCFKYIELPEGYNKVCLEWEIPKGNETIEEYCQYLIPKIDDTKPFVLLGYSFGGMIVQELNKFITPSKTIVLSSVVDEKQIPFYIKLGKFLKVSTWFPYSFLNTEKKGFLSYHFFRTIYHGKKDGVIDYIMPFNLSYLKWAIGTVTQWEPTFKEPISNLYQISGTEDPVFPYSKIVLCKDEVSIYTIKKGNHLMALLEPKKVSKAIGSILED